MQARRIFQTFEPYAWEPSNRQLASELGLREEEIIRFDTNTSPYIPEELLESLSHKLGRIRVNQYPDTSYYETRRALSEYVGVDMDQIIVTNGADEALDMTAKTFIDPGAEALTSTPTYSFYRVVVELLNGHLVEVPRVEGFQDDLSGLLRAASGRSRVIYLCSPNNPTGNLTSRETLIRLLEESGCVVVVDEAYSEFAGESSVDLTQSYSNLVVVRTFSKAFSLAGARVGYIVSGREATDLLNKTRPPNSLSVISLALVEAALENLGVMKRVVERLVGERERCAELLQRCPGIHVYPSYTNFLLIRLMGRDASYVYRELLKQGYVVRNLSGVRGLEGCLRFSMGLPEQNDALLSALLNLVEG